MTEPFPDLTDRRPRVVGSFGNRDDLKRATVAQLAAACDLAEIRLDLLTEGAATAQPAQWQHLEGFPLLFTARRGEEGGAGNLDAAQRSHLLELVLDDAALIDVEVASIGEMRPLLDSLQRRRIPWVASFHNFEMLPETGELEDAAARAKSAGAAAFKAAAMLRQPADIARLADFQLADHGIPVSTMGMGPLALVSRLLCAQCGSVLNYGFLGESPTAPGQWDAALLKQAVAALSPFVGNRP